MIPDAEVDRILQDWLAEGADRAPRDDVAAALATATRTRQRDIGWALPFVANIATSRGWALLAAALLLVVLGLAIAVAGGRWRDAPAPTAVPVEDGPPDPLGLQPVAPDDWAASLSIPAGWTEVAGACCETKVFAGNDPRGQIAVSHGSPFGADVCTPTCKLAEVPASIPYSADAQLAQLKEAAASAAGIDGPASWGTPPAGTPRELVGAAGIETARDVGGVTWRTVVVVGLRDRNVVAISWSQPADAVDQALFTEVLDSVVLPSGPVYSDGDLVESATSGAGFTLPVPGVWSTVDQPEVGGRGLTGVRQFGDGRIVVSIGSTDGSIGWCEPTCRLVEGQTSLDALEAMVRAGDSVTSVEAWVLDGEDARVLRGDPATGQRYVVAMHDEHPVALAIDPAGDVVAPGTIERMLVEFRFADPELAASASAFEAADGSVSVSLPSGWTRSTVRDDRFYRTANQELTIHAGAEDGSIVTCADPAGPWERCGTVTVHSLEELVDQVRFTGAADHGIPPGPRSEDEIEVDGEPAVKLVITAYEYPAHGGQEVAYIAAWHAGRPYLFRVHTTANTIRDLDAVIDGIHFLD